MEDDNLEEEKENSENFLIQNDIDNEEEEESDSISDEKNKRIFVYIRIRPFTPFEEKIDKASPFKLIDIENNSIECNTKIN